MVRRWRRGFMPTRTSFSGISGRASAGRSSQRQDVENIPESRPGPGLERATKDSEKGEYSKGDHSFEMLARIDRREVEASARMPRQAPKRVERGVLAKSLPLRRRHSLRACSNHAAFHHFSPALQLQLELIPQDSLPARTHPRPAPVSDSRGCRRSRKPGLIRHRNRRSARNAWPPRVVDHGKDGQLNRQQIGEVLKVAAELQAPAAGP